MEKKSWTTLVSSYFFGIVAAIPMILAVYLVKTYWLEHAASIRRILFFGFVLIGFLSEFFKFLFLRYKFAASENFTKPFDGILYSILISMGFATVANVFFYFEWDYTQQLATVLYTLPFANILIAIILGFFVGMGKFRVTTVVDSLTGLVAAIFFQGFYNFCLLSQDYLLLGLVSFGTLVISILLAVKSVNTDGKNMTV